MTVWYHAPTNTLGLGNKNYFTFILDEDIKNHLLASLLDKRTWTYIGKL